MVSILGNNKSPNVIIINHDNHVICCSSCSRQKIRTMCGAFGWKRLKGWFGTWSPLEPDMDDRWWPWNQGFLKSSSFAGSYNDFNHVKNPHYVRFSWHVCWWCFCRLQPLAHEATLVKWITFARQICCKRRNEPRTPIPSISISSKSAMDHRYTLW